MNFVIALTYMWFDIGMYYVYYWKNKVYVFIFYFI
jgi:hypothetical protein